MNHSRTIPRVLFILKRREDYSQDPSYSGTGMSTGLLNSSSFVNSMLVSNGIESKVVVVIDNNDINREVTSYNPTHVIIEALWVVPTKFEVLSKLHPTVKWIVRYHSDAPFIAGEGIAMQWTIQYLKNTNVILGINSPKFLSEVRELARITHGKNGVKHVIYLPNYYPTQSIVLPKSYCDNTVKVGCFGAVRPLKNQLIQALAAIKFARAHDVVLQFHINGDRTEGNGGNSLKNIRALFSELNSTKYRLVEHEWMPHDKFKALLTTMDLALQVSFSETFNIVAADCIVSGIPVIGSSEIPWLRSGIASPTQSDDIATSMSIAWKFKKYNVLRNALSLCAYSSDSESIWVDTLLNNIGE